MEMNCMRRCWIVDEIKSQLNKLEQVRKKLLTNQSPTDKETRDFTADDGSLKVHMEGHRFLQIVEWTQCNSSTGSLEFSQVQFIAGKLCDKQHWIICEFTDACVKKVEEDWGHRITKDSTGKTIRLLDYDFIIKGTDATQFWRGATYQPESEVLKAQSNKGKEQNVNEFQRSIAKFVEWKRNAVPEIVFRVSHFEVVSDHDNPVWSDMVSIAKCQHIMNRVLALPRLFSPSSTSSHCLQMQLHRENSYEGEDDEAEIRSQPISPDIPPHNPADLPDEENSLLDDSTISQMQFATQMEPKDDTPSSSPIGKPAAFCNTRQQFVDLIFTERMDDLHSDHQRKANKLRKNRVNCHFENNWAKHKESVNATTQKESLCSEYERASKSPTLECNEISEKSNGRKKIAHWSDNGNRSIPCKVLSTSIIPLHPGWKGMVEISDSDVKISKRQKKILMDSSTWYVPIEHLEQDVAPSPATPMSSPSEGFDWSPTPPRDQMPPDSSAVQPGNIETPAITPSRQKKVDNILEEDAGPLFSLHAERSTVTRLIDKEAVNQVSPVVNCADSSNDETNATSEVEVSLHSESECEVHPPVINPQGHTAAQKYGILGSQNILLRKKRQEEKKKRRLSGEPDTEDELERYNYHSPESYYGETSSDEVEKKKRNLETSINKIGDASERVQRQFGSKRHLGSRKNDMISMLASPMAISLSGPSSKNSPTLSPKDYKNNESENDEIPQGEPIAFSQDQHKVEGEVAVACPALPEDSNDTYDRSCRTRRISARDGPRKGRKSSLNSSPSRAFRCNFCAEYFKRSEHLKRHISTVHIQEKPFSCEICTKKCSRLDNLTQHMRLHKLEAKLSVNLDFGDNPKSQSHTSQRMNELNDEDAFVTAGEEQTKGSEITGKARSQSAPSELDFESCDNVDHWDGQLTHRTFLDSQDLPEEHNDFYTPKKHKGPVVQVQETPYSTLKRRTVPIEQSPSVTVVQAPASLRKDNNGPRVPTPTKIPIKRKPHSDELKSINKRPKKKRALWFDLSQDDPPVDLAKMVQEQKEKALCSIGFGTGDKISRDLCSEGGNMLVSAKALTDMNAINPQLSSTQGKSQNPTIAQSSAHISCNINPLPSSNSIETLKNTHTKTIPAGTRPHKNQATCVRLLGKYLEQQVANKEKRTVPFSGRPSTAASRSAGRPATRLSNRKDLKEGIGPTINSLYKSLPKLQQAESVASNSKAFPSNQNIAGQLPPSIGRATNKTSDGESEGEGNIT